MKTGKHGNTGTSAQEGKSLSTSLPVYLSTYRIVLWFLPLAFLAIFFFLPLSHILSLTFRVDSLTPENLRTTYEALRFTLYQATLSTFLTLLLGLPSAILFARYNF